MTLALIGGEGKMPHLIIQEARAKGHRIFLLAIKGITPTELAQKADEVEWLYLTQLGKAIRACQRRKISQLIMAGRVVHRAIYALSFWRMDLTSLLLWFRMKDKRAESLLSAVADAFARKGIQLMNSVGLLQRFLAVPGQLTKAGPHKREEEEIRMGIAAVKQLASLDIGQTLVVKKGAIVAVEAMEGTDQCLQRAGELAGSGCIVIKMPKAKHDMRFDVPTIGKNTLEKLIKIQARGLVIEAERTLILDEEVRDLADAHGIFIIAWEAQQA